jgi:hypothetical protein
MPEKYERRPKEYRTDEQGIQNYEVGDSVCAGTED